MNTAARLHAALAENHECQQQGTRFANHNRILAAEIAPVSDQRSPNVNFKRSFSILLIIVDISVSSRLAAVLSSPSIRILARSTRNDEWSRVKNCGINWMLILKAIEPIDPFLYRTGHNQICTLLLWYAPVKSWSTWAPPFLVPQTRAKSAIFDPRGLILRIEIWDFNFRHFSYEI